METSWIACVRVCAMPGSRCGKLPAPPCSGGRRYLRPRGNPGSRRPTESGQPARYSEVVVHRLLRYRSAFTQAEPRMSKIEARLAELGLTLPPAVRPPPGVVLPFRFVRVLGHRALVS